MMITVYYSIPFRNYLFNSLNIIINMVVRTFYAISNNYGKFLYGVHNYLTYRQRRTTLMQFQRVGYGLFFFLTYIYSQSIDVELGKLILSLA